METTDTYFVAIDLGTTQIRGIAAQKNGSGQITVLGVETEAASGIARGQIREKYLVTPALGRIITKLNNRLPVGVSITRSYVGMGGYSIVSKDIEETISDFGGGKTELTAAVLEEITERAERHANTENTVIYEILNQEFLLDGKPAKNVEGLFCEQCTAKFLFLTGSPDLDKNINETIDLVPQTALADCFVSPFALAEALTSADDRRQGCAVIDFGGETTSVTVYANGFPRRVSVLPFGGKTITGDLCTMLEIDGKEADELKIKYGHALISLLGKEAGEVELSLGNGKKEKVHRIAEITEARIDEIMDLVCYEIAKVSNPAKLEAGIIITGGAARLRGIENLINLKTGLNVRRGSMEDLLATEKEKYNRYENHLLLALVRKASENCVVKDLPKPEPKPKAQPEPEPLPEPKKGFLNTLFGSRNDEKGWN